MGLLKRKSGQQSILEAMQRKGMLYSEDIHICPPPPMPPTFAEVEAQMIERRQTKQAKKQIINAFYAAWMMNKPAEWVTPEKLEMTEEVFHIAMKKLMADRLIAGYRAEAKDYSKAGITLAGVRCVQDMNIEDIRYTNEYAIEIKKAANNITIKNSRGPSYDMYCEIIDWAEKHFGF